MMSCQVKGAFDFRRGCNHTHLGLDQELEPESRLEDVLDDQVGGFAVDHAVGRDGTLAEDVAEPSWAGVLVVDRCGQVEVTRQLPA